MRVAVVGEVERGDGPVPDLDALVANWPLVGRDALIARVLGAIAPGAPGVVLSGPAGVGKSLVARAITGAAKRDGVETAWVQATTGTRDLLLGAFGRLLPTEAHATTPLDLLRRTAAAIQRQAAGRVLVLAVDDAHLLDPASATLVHQVASSGPVFVLATVRSGEEAPDAVVSLWKDGLALRVDVGELDEREVADVLHLALDGDVEVATARRLWLATHGNALFLHELVLAGIRSGSLHRRSDLWCWRGPLSGDGGLRDVLHDRLAPLDERARGALFVLAAGEPVSVDIFERMVGIEVVDELERQGLVRIRRDDRREEASLAHPLYRDVLRGGMTPAELAVAREGLAEAVERAGGRRRGDLLRVALWRLAGPVEARADLLLAAAAEAEARFDLVLAERLARAAVERGGGSLAWHAVASALREQGRSVEADDAWATALDLESVPAVRVLLSQARSANLFFGLGEGAKAIAVLDAVIPDAATQGLRDTIGSLVSMFDLYRGRIDTALAAAVPILERTEVHADARIDAALTASAAYALRGRPADAIAVVDENIAVAMQNPEVGPISAGALLASRFLAVALDGRLEEAMGAAQVVYDLAVELGTHDGIAALSFAIGHVHQAQGNIDAARRHLVEGAALLREHDRNGYLPWCLGELGYVHLLAGDVDLARETVAELDLVARPEVRLFQPRVDAARLTLRAVDGDRDAALDSIVDAGCAAADDGHVVLGAMALHEAVRFGGASRVAGPLDRLAMSSSSGLVRAFAASARATAAGDGAALDDAAATFEAMGALLLAAEASSAAAEAHRSSGANALRAAAVRRTAHLLARCPGAAPPWLPVHPEAEPLTSRQLEIATLVAEGLTNREVGQRLFLSVRTVDNHLYRIYAKLGVDRRDELAAVLPRAQPPPAR